MSKKHTERVRKVMELANEEARQFNHEYVGTEHLLLGLVKEGNGAGANVLKRLGADLSKVRSEIENLVKPGPEPVAKGKLPQTPRVKEMMKYAVEQANNFNRNYVGTEHLLLGFLHERESVAAQALMNLGLNLEEVHEEVFRLLKTAPGAGHADDQDLPEEPVAPAEVVEYVTKLFSEALQANASDIHFDQGEGGWGQVRVRTDGVLHIVDPPPDGVYPKVVDYIKAMAAMNVTERQLPQDGQCRFDVNGRNVRLFVSAVPAYYGERIVIRILSQEKEDILMGLSNLGLSDKDLENVRNLSHLPSGIVIVNGPTDNGKTTLLYSMLMEINTPEICIMTVEDPVEITFASMGQIQIKPQLGLTFPRAIRHILRQDPDVIMVGEIRDLETLEVSNQCALTGHLVLTTLHANTSPGAVKRLLDMGLKPWLVSSSLAGVVSMRLVRTLCPKCKEPANPPLHSLPPEAVQFVASHKDAQFFKPKGCEHCGGGHGYRGRTGIFEVLVMNDRLRQLVTDGSPLQTLRAAAKEEGMKTLLMDGLEKAAKGITSIEEVLRVVPVGEST